jgi:hypothetical protein
MKYTKYKEIIHISLFGYDDELRGMASSISLTSPISIAFGGLSDTKRLRFRFTPMNDVILSNYARIVIECANLPAMANVVTGAGSLQAPFTIRTTSLTNYKSFDSQNNGTNPLLIFYSNKSDDFFQNNDANILFNYSVDKTFLQRGEVDLILQYPTDTTLRQGTCFDTFAITFIIYDIDEELLLTENTSEYKKEHLKYPQTYLNNTETSYNTQSFNKKLGY